MFGYVTPLEGELKVKEHRLYKAVYCGLCRAMGKRVCTESRLTLSYDMVFLALVRFLLDEEPLTLEQIRCGTSVHKKRTVIARNPVLDYCGAAGAVLTYHNIADDVRDKKGFRRLAARLLLISAKRMRKKAALPILDGEVGALLTRLDGEESSADASPDSCASVFGELLGHVFAYGYEGEKRLIAYEIGFHTGKWIYLLDAADDFERDKKRGEFNPLTELSPERVMCSLNLELEGVSRALSLITPYDMGIMELTENIIYLGMPYRAKKILCGDTEEAFTDDEKGKS